MRFIKIFFTLLFICIINLTPDSASAECASNTCTTAGTYCYYSEPLTSCKSCSDDTTTHPNSTLGDNIGIEKCYKNCPNSTDFPSVTNGVWSCDNDKAYYNNSCSCTLICDENHYRNGDTCTACNNGYTSPAGSTSSAQCTKNCPNIMPSGGNGTWAPDSNPVSQPNDCTYTTSSNLSCNPGYYVSGTGANATCQPCPTGFYKTVANNLTSCSPCAAGKTNTGTGNISCGTNCDNCNQPTCTWTQGTWANGKYCIINSCTNGYKPNPIGETNNTCIGRPYKVGFNAGTSGSFSSPMNPVTCEWPNICSWTANTVSHDTMTFTKWLDAHGTSSIAPAHTSYKPANTNAPTTDNQLYTLTAQWTSCTNIANVQTMGPNCTITACNPGYRIIGTGPNNVCEICNTMEGGFSAIGRYCPGGDPNNMPPGCDNGGVCLCPVGYYCNGSANSSPGTPTTPCLLGGGDTTYYGRCACPPGSTTFSTKNSSIEGCTMRAGITKFCDSSNACFYLPTDIPY